MNENRDTLKEILLKIPFHIRCCLISGILGELYLMPIC